MKNIITTLAIFTLTLSAVFANTTPEVLISTSDIEVVTINDLDIFSSSKFDVETESLVFNTNDDISMVQIFDNEGEVIFLLPVMSDNVQIKKNLFESGKYKLGFVIEGETQVHLTDVTIK